MNRTAVIEITLLAGLLLSTGVQAGDVEDIIALEKGHYLARNNGDLDTWVQYHLPERDGFGPGGALLSQGTSAEEEKRSLQAQLDAGRGRTLIWKEVRKAQTFSPHHNHQHSEDGIKAECNQEEAQTESLISTFAGKKPGLTQSRADFIQSVQHFPVRFLTKEDHHPFVHQDESSRGEVLNQIH